MFEVFAGGAEEMQDAAMFIDQDDDPAIRIPARDVMTDEHW